MKTIIENNLGVQSVVDISWVHATKVSEDKPQYTQCKVKITTRVNNEERSFQAMSRVYKGENYNKRKGRILTFKKVMCFDELKEVINKENRTLIFKNFFSLSKKDANILKSFTKGEPTTKVKKQTAMLVVA